MKRLLLLACSATKRSLPGRLPALERYDGPAFRTLRSYLRDLPDQASSLDLLILSAEFGLITGDTPIPMYDRRMTPSHALWLRPQVRSRLMQQLADQCYTSTFINLGADYLPALPLDPAIVVQFGNVCSAVGGIGARLGQLKRWLYTS